MLKKIILTTTRKINFIKFTSKELSAICPVNGQPDYYELEIEIAPRKYTIEVSTLREFILNFRYKEILAEELTDEICATLYEVLEPHYLSVKLFNPSESNIGIEIYQQIECEEKL